MVSNLNTDFLMICNILIYPCQNPRCGVLLEIRTLVLILGGVRMTEGQKRMKELLIQSDAEITDQILSAVLAKFGTPPVESNRPDPAQEACPSFPKS